MNLDVLKQFVRLKNIYWLSYWNECWLEG